MFGKRLSLEPKERNDSLRKIEFKDKIYEKI